MHIRKITRIENKKGECIKPRCCVMHAIEPQMKSSNLSQKLINALLFLFSAVIILSTLIGFRYPDSLHACLTYLPSSMSHLLCIYIFLEHVTLMHSKCHVNRQCDIRVSDHGNIIVILYLIQRDIQVLCQQHERTNRCDFLVWNHVLYNTDLVT